MKREGARERERDEGKIEREEEKMEWEAFRLKYQKKNKWKKKNLAVRPCCRVGLGSLTNVAGTVLAWSLDTIDVSKPKSAEAESPGPFEDLQHIFWVRATVGSCSWFPSWAALKRWIRRRKCGYDRTQLIRLWSSSGTVMAWIMWRCTWSECKQHVKRSSL